jgi:hypothetical protein
MFTFHFPKTIVISREERYHNIKLAGKALEQVKQYKYLGAFIRSKCRIDEEIKNRISITGKLYFMLNQNCMNKKEVTWKTKLTVSKTSYILIITYGLCPPNIIANCKPMK